MCSIGYKRNYGIMPRDIVTDGGYASKDNARIAQGKGIINIVFNKIKGSLEKYCQKQEYGDAAEEMAQRH